MNIVRTAALTDPGTPAHVLAAIAGTDTDERTSAHLLAHPNTPAAALTDRRLTKFHHARAALTSPAAVDATHARTLAATSAPVLAELIATEYYWVRDPRLVAELGARQGSEPSGTAAILLMDHPLATPEVQLSAVRAVAAHLTSLSSDLGPRLTLAASAHPEHLREFADLTRNAAGKVSDALHQLADVHDTGGNARATLLAEVRERLTYGALPAALAVLQYPDPDLAFELYVTHHSDLLLLDALWQATALTGTKAWQLAHLSVSRTLPPAPDLDLPDNLNLAAALHATKMTHRVARASREMLPSDPRLMDAAATGALRIAADSGDPSRIETARHIARLLLHPHTPATRHEELTASARALADEFSGRYAGRHGLDLALTLTADGPGTATATLANVPLPQLPALAGSDKQSYAEHLAHWAAPLLTPAWRDADTVRAAIALEDSFPGTLPELVATAASITA